jgi:hypothetical protein
MLLGGDRPIMRAEQSFDLMAPATQRGGKINISLTFRNTAS